jgi:hypothetical protein
LQHSKTETQRVPDQSATASDVSKSAQDIPYGKKSGKTCTERKSPLDLLSFLQPKCYHIPKIQRQTFNPKITLKRICLKELSSQTNDIIKAESEICKGSLPLKVSN